MISRYRIDERLIAKVFSDYRFSCDEGYNNIYDRQSGEIIVENIYMEKDFQNLFLATTAMARKYAELLNDDFNQYSKEIDLFVS